jgi:hypothetical protein
MTISVVAAIAGIPAAIASARAQMRKSPSRLLPLTMRERPLPQSAQNAIMGSNGLGRRHRPAECTGAKKEPIFGKPDPAMISTSHVERRNFTMRMGMRCITRLTNGFSRKPENHLHRPPICFVRYNSVRMHKSLRMTPAMASGVTDGLQDMAFG